MEGYVSFVDFSGEKLAVLSISLLLIVSTSLLTFTSNAITLISDIWFDDFAYDINGINGWDDNNIINGTSKLYHGWYSGNDDGPPSLSRSFQCSQPSLIQLSFTIYFACNVEDSDALIISFDGEAKENIIWDNLRNTPQIFDVDEPIVDATCSTTPSIGFKGSNQSMIISEKPIRESTSFVIKFEFMLSSGVGSEFEGISDIKIQCIPATSPSLACFGHYLCSICYTHFESICTKYQHQQFIQTVLALRFDAHLKGPDAGEFAFEKKVILFERRVVVDGPQNEVVAVDPGDAHDGE